MLLGRIEAAPGVIRIMAQRSLDCVIRHLRQLARPAAKNLTDQQLLERFATERDEAAFAALVERHGPLVWSVCRRWLQLTQDAEDVFQATFLVLLRKAGAIRWRSSVAGWLYQVAHRLARESRAKTAQRRRLEGRALEARSTATCDNPSRELATILDEELQRLPDVYRTPLLLCYLEGLTGDQAAQRLDWSLRTLQRRLSHGRERLRRRLLRQGITLSAALLAPALSRSSTVPSSLLAAVMKGITPLAIGAMPASAEAIALADGFMKGMVMSKFKCLVVTLLVLTATAGTGALLERALARSVPEFRVLGPAAAERASEDPKEKAASAFADPRPEVKALAERVWTIVDVVAKRHLEPCPREQMLTAGLKALARATKSEVSTDLEHRAAEVASAEQLAALIQLVWPKSEVLSRDKAEKALLDGVLASIPGKPRLAAPPDAKEQKQQEMISGNRYVGIGIILKTDDKEKRPQVGSAILRGAARRAGMKAGDFIVTVDGKDTHAIPLAQVVDWLRGEEGSKVTVTVRQAGETEIRTYTMTRAKVPFEHVFGYRRTSEEDYDFHAEPQTPIAYVHISGLVSSTLHELRQVERKLQAAGFRALVLDLRFGSGGSYQHAALLCGGVLDGGLMWSTRLGEGQGRQEFRANRECLFRDWPIVVLINGQLDSADSLVAAALHDNDRAVLVGEASPMDGYVKSIVELPGQADSLVLPIGRVDRPAAARGWPLRPDHLEPMDANQRKAVAEWTQAQTISDRPIDPKAKAPPDPQLAKAVELLREELRRSRARNLDESAS
jgi:C-terminal peptidase prc